MRKASRKFYPTVLIALGLIVCLAQFAFAAVPLSITGKIGSELAYIPDQGLQFRSGLGFGLKVETAGDISGYFSVKGLSVDSADGMVFGHEPEDRKLTFEIDKIWVRFDKPLFEGARKTPYTIGDIYLNYSPYLLYDISGQRGVKLENVYLPLGDIGDLTAEGFFVWDSSRGNLGDHTFGMMASGKLMGNNAKIYSVTSLDSTRVGQGLDQYYVINGEGLETTYLLEMDRSLDSGVNVSGAAGYLSHMAPSGNVTKSSMLKLKAENINFNDKVIVNISARKVDSNFTPKYRAAEDSGASLLVDDFGETGAAIDANAMVSGVLVKPGLDIYTKAGSNYKTMYLELNKEILGANVTGKYVDSDEDANKVLTLTANKDLNLFGGIVGSTLDVSQTVGSSGKTIAGGLKLETTRDIFLAKSVKIFGEVKSSQVFDLSGTKTADTTKYGVGIDYILPGGPRLWIRYYTPIDLNDPDHWQDRIVKLEFWHDF